MRRAREPRLSLEEPSHRYRSGYDEKCGHEAAAAILLRPLLPLGPEWSPVVFKLPVNVGKSRSLLPLAAELRSLFLQALKSLGVQAPHFRR